MRKFYIATVLLIVSSLVFGENAAGLISSTANTSPTQPVSLTISTSSVSTANAVLLTSEVNNLSQTVTSSTSASDITYGASTNTASDLTEEQRRAIIIKVFKDATDNEELFKNEYAMHSLIAYTSSTMIKSKINNIINHLILFSLTDPCNSCVSHGCIVADDRLNVISSTRDNTKGGGEFSFIDLSCDGNIQILCQIHEIWAEAAGTIKDIIYRTDKECKIEKILDAEISFHDSPESYSGEKTPYEGTLTYSNCRSNSLKDIIITKKCEHYDDYFKDGKIQREILDKTWVIKETWKFNGSKYVLKKTEGHNPLHNSEWDRFLNSFFHVKKKPMMSDKYHGA
jgi:hypothetical protein